MVALISYIHCHNVTQVTYWPPKYLIQYNQKEYVSNDPKYWIVLFQRLVKVSLFVIKCYFATSIYKVRK